MDELFSDELVDFGGAGLFLALFAGSGLICFVDFEIRGFKLFKFNQSGLDVDGFWGRGMVGSGVRLRVV
ncbi:MAG: hypothetical protein IJC63_04665 [Myxococcaceae bacterium]|nr:hypothetical protein [Myxococcaceae bacterium]